MKRGGRTHGKARTHAWVAEEGIVTAPLDSLLMCLGGLSRSNSLAFLSSCSVLGFQITHSNDVGKNNLFVQLEPDPADVSEILVGKVEMTARVHLVRLMFRRVLFRWLLH